MLESLSHETDMRFGLFQFENLYLFKDNIQQNEAIFSYRIRLNLNFLSSIPITVNFLKPLALDMHEVLFHTIEKKIIFFAKKCRKRRYLSSVCQEIKVFFFFFLFTNIYLFKFLRNPFIFSLQTPSLLLSKKFQISSKPLSRKVIFVSDI